MGKNLQEFDHTWVAYEQIYVLELMLIEADARRFITEAIEPKKSSPTLSSGKSPGEELWLITQSTTRNGRK